LRIRGRRGAESIFCGRRGEPNKASLNFELVVFGAQSFSNSWSSALNPSSSKPNIRPAAEAGFPPIMQPIGPPTNGAERPASNWERGFGQRLQNSADVKCREAPNYLT